MQEMMNDLLKSLEDTLFKNSPNININWDGLEGITKTEDHYSGLTNIETTKQHKKGKK